MENGLDPGHNEFVHPTHGHAGVDRETYKVNDYETEDHNQGWGFWFMHRFYGPPLPQKGHATSPDQQTPWGETRTKDGDVYAGGGTYGPNAMATYINIQPKPNHKGFRQYFFEQPVDDSHTRIFFLNMRDFLLDPSNDGPIHARNKVIAGQDIQVLEEVNPVTTPVSSTKEVLMPADKAIAEYRKWLSRFDDMGFRIDMKKLQERNGKDVAYAIPCPARRTSGNWVLEPVPLVEGKAARKEAAA